VRREIRAWAWIALLLLAVLIVGCAAVAAVVAVAEGESPTGPFLTGLGALLAALSRGAE
jgi:hypothetical protein